MEDFAIRVDGVSKTFKLPKEKNSSIKAAFVNVFSTKKGYELQKALSDVSFDIKKGEFFGIVGRNGSGKSTLLKMLAGIYPPTKGHVQVSGTLTPFIELGVGFNPELTGRENVFLNGALLGFNRKEMSAMYNDIVEFAELKKFMGQKLKNYSSGMQVRLAFSIAIRAKSDILLLDEVLAVGDAAFQQKCYDYFEELKAEKRTVVFVSHDMGAVTRFCTRAVYIKDSKLIMNGTPYEVAEFYRAENIRNDADDQVGTVGGQTKSKSHTISAKITSQNHDKTVAEIKYRSKKAHETYVGIAILKNGVSIAEITTPLEKPLGQSGTLTYSIDNHILNGGIYELSVALFKLNNRELLAIGKNQQFKIEGFDITKGAALKLADNWENI